MNYMDIYSGTAETRSLKSIGNQQQYKDVPTIQQKMKPSNNQTMHLMMNVNTKLSFMNK